MLERSRRLVDLMRDAALGLPETGHTSPADHFIQAHGFAGAFTAVWESIHRVEANHDKTLNPALDEWRKTARAAYDRRGNEIRNRLAHQAALPIPQWELEWVESAYHDTEFPVLSTTFVEHTYSGGSTRRLTLREWAIENAVWWEWQLNEIARIAKRQRPRSSS